MTSLQFSMRDAIHSGGPSRRNPAIDSLRGFCLFGIAVVNVFWIGRSRPLYLDLFLDHPSLTEGDRLFGWIVEFAFEGKFYPQFAFLFGVGAYKNCEANPKRAVRRFIALMVLGFLHSVLGWSGDVLFDYGCIGLILVFLRRLMIRWGALVGLIGIFASVLIAYKWDEWPIQQMDLSQHIAQLEERGKAYRSGDFISISFLRFEDWLKSFGTSEWSYLANLASMVILGFGISNRFDFEKLNKEFMAKLAVMAWMLGAAISVAVRVFTPIYVLQADVLAIAYASSWLLLANRWQNSSVISFFEKAGSVSLTIYLLETVVFSSVFYGSGLGWLDRLGVFECLLLAAGTFLLLVILLRAWLKFFLMGPFEWMWRSFAEMRLLPIWR